MQIFLMHFMFKKIPAYYLAHKLFNPVKWWLTANEQHFEWLFLIISVAPNPQSMRSWREFASIYFNAKLQYSVKNDGQQAWNLYGVFQLIGQTVVWMYTESKSESVRPGRDFKLVF